MALTLDQLRAIETKLLTALGDPTLSVAYDHFRRENRPIGDIQKSLDQVRSEISALCNPAGTKPRVRRNLPLAISDL